MVGRRGMKSLLSLLHSHSHFVVSGSGGRGGSDDDSEGRSQHGHNNNTPITTLLFIDDVFDIMYLRGREGVRRAGR
jgi:hypothetical protein